MTAPPTRASRARHRAPLVMVAALAVVLASSPAARANGDPASDYLLVTPVFYPFQPRTSPPLRRTLEGALAQLNAKGLKLKVAIIGSAIDLGAVPNLFGRPQAYADFLEPEISFNETQPLLVVMPAGFGVSHAGSADALRGVTVDTRHQANGLARSAILAVIALARANGKPISVSGVPTPVKASKGGVSPLITFGAPAAFVLLVVFVLSVLRRRPAAGDEHEQQPAERPPSR
jgi:hypothetical protein